MAHLRREVAGIERVAPVDFKLSVPVFARVGVRRRQREMAKPRAKRGVSLTGRPLGGATNKLQSCSASNAELWVGEGQQADRHATGVGRSPERVSASQSRREVHFLRVAEKLRPPPSKRIDAGANPATGTLEAKPDEAPAPV